MTLDLIETLAFAGLVLFGGYGIRSAVPPLARLHIPAPVIGGLVVALGVLAARSFDWPTPTFDTSLQRPLMIAFFATVGFAASLQLLRIGGPQVAAFLLLASVFAVLQNLIGIAIALMFGQPALFGVLAGSVTLTGGPATGLAFAPQFEAAGVVGAASIAVAVSMAGIILGGLVGGPLVGRLITQSFGRKGGEAGGEESRPPVVAVQSSVIAADPEGDESAEAYVALKTVVIVLASMWAGEWIGRALGATGLTLPAYIGAMIAAALLRAVDDYTGWLGLSHRTIETIGVATLSLFLVMALMTLDLTKLAGLAAPLLVILAAQVVLVALAVWPVFRIMGSDYDAAVMSGGFVGFMLGTTANAMAVMRTLVEKFGVAPRAFLVAPLVGAFFIDFTNALIITVLLNVLA